MHISTSYTKAETNIFLYFLSMWPLARPNIAKEGWGCFEVTGEQAGIGLRRENVDFPDLQKVETWILVILCLNWPILNVRRYSPPPLIRPEALAGKMPVMQLHEGP